MKPARITTLLLPLFLAACLTPATYPQPDSAVAPKTAPVTANGQSAASRNTQAATAADDKLLAMRRAEQLSRRIEFALAAHHSTGLRLDNGLTRAPATVTPTPTAAPRMAAKPSTESTLAERPAPAPVAKPQGAPRTNLRRSTERRESPAEAEKLVEEYQIGVDDVVRVNVWGSPELSIEVPVRPDGRISLPLVGDMRAGGLTPSELAEDIKEALSYYIRDPNVVVILAGLNSHEYISRVRVTGAVREPVSISYRPAMTVVDAILAAGGVNEFAAADRSKLYRKDGEKTEVIEIRLKEILNGGKLETNILLRPGDMIAVPERLF